MMGQLKHEQEQLFYEFRLTRWYQAITLCARSPACSI